MSSGFIKVGFMRFYWVGFSIAHPDKNVYLYDEAHAFSLVYLAFIQYRFAVKQVVRPFGILFSNYGKNTKTTNHYIIKMFHRIAIECEMPALLYQVGSCKYSLNDNRSSGIGEITEILEISGIFIFSNISSTAGPILRSLMYKFLGVLGVLCE